MIIKPQKRRNSYARAFSLVEVLISMVVFGATFLALYSGLSNSFSIIKVAREKLRASQIISERFEAIRLFQWDYMMKDPATLSWTNTSEYYDFAQNSGILYNVNISFGNGPSDVSYSNCLKLVNIKVTWHSGQVNYTNEMTSYIAFRGLQEYVY